MKAQVIMQFGDVSVFETKEVPKPLIKPGYVLVRVMATSVNPVDYKLRSGMIPPITPAFPAILHGDVAGVVEEVGAGVVDFRVGDEVYGCAGGVAGEGGALAEWMLVDAKLIAKKPRGLSMAEAAALPLVSITAWEILFEKITRVAGKKILVHGGVGGVGHLVVQLASLLAADVYVTVSSSEKGDIATSLGANTIINYRQESVQEYVARLTAGKGFDVVIDTVGGKNLDASMEAVALYGDVVTIESSSTHDLSKLHMKSANLHVVLMLIPLLHNIQRERHGMILKNMAGLVEKKLVRPLVHAERFSFADVGKAHALLESGRSVGKVVICRDG
jgi:NADPH2:quinone reductase